jgi:uncharacterized protein YyaL (SSP411 family)
MTFVNNDRIRWMADERVVTPDLKPFYGGTYFAFFEVGQAGFVDILQESRA